MKMVGTELQMKQLSDIKKEYDFILEECNQKLVDIFSDMSDKERLKVIKTRDTINAINRLDDAKKNIILLYLANGKSIQKMGQIFCCFNKNGEYTYSTLANLISKIKKQIRDEVNGYKDDY